MIVPNPAKTVTLPAIPLDGQSFGSGGDSDELAPRQLRRIRQAIVAVLIFLLLLVAARPVP